VLASGNGSNLQALIDEEKRGGLGGGAIAGVASDRSGAYALERSRQAGIPACFFPRGPGLSERVLRFARERSADIIILAGFLSILENPLIDAYAGWMINLHPSLLPKFGGKGMHGGAVHRAVLAAGETVSGCTVHAVTSAVDSGAVLLQRSVPVLPEDTPESLGLRVRGEEHRIIAEAAELLVRQRRLYAGR
jgi:phosphoribosylglycinamide formyltransferase-1